MRERRRNLTRRQKEAATKAGLEASEFYFCAENNLYWFLISKTDAEKRVSVPKQTKRNGG